MTARFPAWLRRQAVSGTDFDNTKAVLDGLGLNTVCRSAHCPNQGECWKQRTATLMILGDQCSRHCAFCAVKAGHPIPVDPQEPEKVAQAVAQLGLAHVVVTSVTRDDLTDGGAGHFAQTVSAIRAQSPGTTIEVLVPDFQGKTQAVEQVIAAQPDVFGHNIETVERLFSQIRDRRARYACSLAVLHQAAERASRGVMTVKSGLMVGLGEQEEEVIRTLHELLEAGCRAVTIGQYLRPTPAHYAVAEFVTPETFQRYEQRAYEMGFAYAKAGPFVRSSYHAGEIWDVLRQRHVT